jgi:hypothetical protein
MVRKLRSGMNALVGGHKTGKLLVYECGNPERGNLLSY